MTTLFTELSDNGHQTTSFALSVLLHFSLIAIVVFSIAYKPRIRRVVTEHYKVRELDLSMPDEQLRAAQDVPYPTQQFSPPTPLKKQSAPSHPASSPARSISAPQAEAPESAANQAAPSPAALPQIQQVKLGPQTLIQPDLQATITVKDEIPVPQVMIWSPSSKPIEKIVPPLPDKQTAADVKPSLAKPNQELNLADINLASSDHPAPAQPVKPSTTSPVTVPNKQPVQLPPVSATQQSAPPTPAALLSLSDLRNTKAVLPPVNEAAASKTQAPPSPNPGKGSSPGNSNSAPAEKPGTGAKPVAAANSSPAVPKTPKPGNDAPPAAPANNQKQSVAGNGSSPALPSPGPKPDAAHSDDGLDFGLNSLGQPAATQITLPKDGRFGAVIVGNSLAEQFPEISSVWQGRVAYTAYLHVGLAKSWILQYSLPRSVDASESGTVAHLDAPWPYNIVRPNLIPGDIDADALMVHGFVDQSGRFETLTVVFPEEFAQAQFVLKALAKWTFRPALQNGQVTRVEVLLIIPEIE